MSQQIVSSTKCIVFDSWFIIAVSGLSGVASKFSGMVCPAPSPSKSLLTVHGAENLLLLIR